MEDVAVRLPQLRRRLWRDQHLRHQQAPEPHPAVQGRVMSLVMLAPSASPLTYAASGVHRPAEAKRSL